MFGARKRRKAKEAELAAKRELAAKAAEAAMMAAAEICRLTSDEIRKKKHARNR